MNNIYDESPLNSYSNLYQCNNRQLLYSYTSGIGPELLLIHGWGIHSGVWDHVVMHLSNTFRVTVMDLPGYGFSRYYPNVFDLESLLKSILSIIPKCPSIWIGWSLGGLIAQMAAIYAKNLVSKLILVSSTPCFVQKPDWPSAIPQLLFNDFIDALNRNHYNLIEKFLILETYGSYNITKYLKKLRNIARERGGYPEKNVLSSGLQILLNSDFREQWLNIKIPIMLINGERDKLVPVDTGNILLKNFPQIKLVIFKHAGHIPFISHVDDFIKVIKEFCDENK